MNWRGASVVALVASSTRVTSLSTASVFRIGFSSPITFRFSPANESREQWSDVRLLGTSVARHFSCDLQRDSTEIASCHSCRPSISETSAAFWSSAAISDAYPILLKKGRRTPTSWLCYQINRRPLKPVVTPGLVLLSENAPPVPRFGIRIQRRWRIQAAFGKVQTADPLRVRVF